MKIFVVLAATFAVGLAAPTNTIVYGTKRTKKSVYGTPCSGGGAQLAPIALYLAPQGSYQGAQHYRESDKTDAETHKHPSARSYYDSGAVGVGGGSLSGGSEGSGSAVGIFPNANVGGCAKPLLLSCAPNVVSGHIVHHAGYAHPTAYREAEMNQNVEMEMKEAGVEAERASNLHHGENVHQTSGVKGIHHHHANMQHNMAQQSTSHQHTQNLNHGTHKTKL